MLHLIAALRVFQKVKREEKDHHLGLHQIHFRQLALRKPHIFIEKRDTKFFEICLSCHQKLPPLLTRRSLGRAFISTLYSTEAEKKLDLEFYAPGHSDRHLSLRIRHI